MAKGKAVEKDVVVFVDSNPTMVGDAPDSDWIIMGIAIIIFVLFVSNLIPHCECKESIEIDCYNNFIQGCYGRVWQHKNLTLCLEYENCTFACMNGKTGLEKPVGGY